MKLKIFMGICCLLFAVNCLALPSNTWDNAWSGVDTNSININGLELVYSVDLNPPTDQLIQFRLNSIGSENYIIIGPVTICTTNGMVIIDPKVPLDEASSNFWKTLETAYPYTFPNYQGLNKSNPPKIK